jgi:hypothetical protein
MGNHRGGMGMNRREYGKILERLDFLERHVRELYTNTSVTKTIMYATTEGFTRMDESIHAAEAVRAIAKHLGISFERSKKVESSIVAVKEKKHGK